MWWITPFGALVEPEVYTIARGSEGSTSRFHRLHERPVDDRWFSVDQKMSQPGHGCTEEWLV